MSPNFEQCGNIFNDNAYSNLSHFRYNGTVYGILQNANRSEKPFITLEGCQTLCGSGPELYETDDIIGTIYIWIIPVLALLVQFPLENSVLRIVLAGLRWMGSPVAALSQILWNIRTVGKCALWVDLAVPSAIYPEKGPSTAARIRDSFFLLSAMGRYSINKSIPYPEAERLIRVALFSNDLRLEVEAEGVEGGWQPIAMRRKRLAKSLRKGRGKETMRVLTALVYFIFSLAVSIRTAFATIGNNESAHDLAMGLLLAWLPVLVLAMAVDRTPGSPQATRLKLDNFIKAVIHAISRTDHGPGSFTGHGKHKQEFPTIARLRIGDVHSSRFFTDFAGQSRVRWHNGVAHSVLASLEATPLTQKGRNWLLENEESARRTLVNGPCKANGLNKFDPHQLWQMLGSVVIVGSCVLGAFIISYFTPTVGLGCRTGGYVIYWSMAHGIFLIEHLCWWLVPDPANSDKLREGRARSQTRNGRNSKRQSDMTARGWIEALIIRPLELLNTLWLAYCMLAQTLGIYRTCECMSSNWGRIGGYIDFGSAEYYQDQGIARYWETGTGLPLAVMFVAAVFIMSKLGLHLHLSTETPRHNPDDYRYPVLGLWLARWFKYLTTPFRRIWNAITHVCRKCFCCCRRRKQDHRQLKWSADGPIGGMEKALALVSIRQKKSDGDDDKDDGDGDDLQYDNAGD